MISKEPQKVLEEKEQIEKLISAEEKGRACEGLRELWRQCFGDPPEYEEFYFSQIYRDNVVYRIKDRGMLHLNPYPCRVFGENQTLHYIVGVATAHAYRRTGVMRRLLTTALMDLYDGRQPFTYLMPASVSYYEPFDFVSVSLKREECVPLSVAAHGVLRASEWRRDCRISENGVLKEFSVNALNMYFVSYDEWEKVFSEREQQEIFHSLEEMLVRQFSVFAVHDRKYVERLYREKQCQNGDVVFCFDRRNGEKRLQGFFAYAMDGEKMVVEQYLFKRGMRQKNRTKAEEWMKEYCMHAGNILRNPKEIWIVHRFPFMLRVVNAEEFLNLFAGYVEDFAGGRRQFIVTDDILPGNTGIYRLEKKRGRMQVSKKGMVEDSPIDVPAVSVAELADIVFGKMHVSGNDIFFSEIV